MKAIIVSVGDELALGQTVDTNSAWISQQLASVGCSVRAHLTVSDDQQAIEQAMLESVGRCDFLLVSGGIGPTEDDLTRQALANVMQAPLEVNEQWLNRLREFFEKRGRPMPESNKIQAMIPRGAAMIENLNGTAAGLDAPYRSGDQKTICRIFVMPGVPKEMKAMFTRAVLPHIQKAGKGACIVSRTLHTFGLGESTVGEKLGTLMKRGRIPSVGTTVSGGVVSVRINACFDSRGKAEAELAATESAVRETLGDIIYGQEDQTLADVVAQLLKDQQKKVSTAESCTGGLLAKMLTDIPGSSTYFDAGVITYSNDMKRERLGVPTEMLNLYGAVSEPVVIAMANGIRRLAKADYALAVSGIAGPEGGSATKPVGTVCIALSQGSRREVESTATARQFFFTGDRETIRDRAAKMAMSMLRYRLMDVAMPF